MYEFLHDGQIPADWLARQIDRIDKVQGDIDTLSKRLAFIRTWTYVSQRKNWVDDTNHWRNETRAVEDRLSDALHNALTQRFVDRRTSVLMRRLKQKESLVADVNEKGEVHVEGQFVGRLEGFRFQLDPKASGEEAKTLRSAAIAALAPAFHLRSDKFYNAPDTEIDVTEQGGLMWGEYALGKLVKGPDILSPQVEVFVDDEAGAEVTEKVRRRLAHWIDRKIAALFEPLVAMKTDETLTGLAKGVAFQLVENLGVVPRAEIANDIKSLDQDQRGMLRKHGIRFGQFTIFQTLMLKPAPTRLRLVLWSLFEGLSEFPEAPPPGLVTVPAVKEAPNGYYPRAGYRLSGERAIRIDMLERLADMIRNEDTRAGFEAKADMLSITGLTLEQFANLLEGMGYKAVKGERVKVKAAEPAKADAVVQDAEKAGEKPEDAKPEPPVEAEASQPATPEGSTSDAPATEGEEAPPMEVFYTFTWAPRRQGGQNKGERKKPENTRKARDNKPKGKGGKPQQRGEKTFKSRPKPVEKPIDPDNPFAALMALKEKG